MADYTNKIYYQNGGPGFQQIVVGAGNAPSGFDEISLQQAQDLVKQNPNVPVSGLGFNFTKDQLLAGNIPASNRIDVPSQGLTFTTPEVAAQAQANEAAVQAGTMKKVPIGSGFGYVPTGTEMPSTAPKVFGANVGSTPTLESIQAGINAAAQKVSALTQQVKTEGTQAPPVSQISPSSSTSELNKGQTTSTPPTASGSNASGVVLSGIAANLETMTQNLQNAYQKQIDSLNVQATNAQKNIDQIEAQQKFALGNVNTLTQPFRQQLEEAQRKSLYINQNFEANQQAISELQSLFTDGQAQIQKLQGTTDFASVINPQISNVAQQITARAGVLQAVMAARNNQISVAENLIDRTANAIASDRKDQLTYYYAILDFYQKEKDTEGNKLITLTKDEKSYLDSQIKITSDQIDNAQKTADYIKQLMVNPSTAGILQEAGVNLNMTIPEINDAVGKVVYRTEVSKQQEDMANSGYQLISATDPRVGQEGSVQIPDSKGVVRYYYKQPSASTKLPAVREDIASMNGALSGKVGADGYVSPNDYAYAKKQWMAGGYTGKNFDDTFSGFRNPNNLDYALTQ